jgi:hypothetical protein
MGWGKRMKPGAGRRWIPSRMLDSFNPAKQKARSFQNGLLLKSVIG